MSNEAQFLIVGNSYIFIYITDGGVRKNTEGVYEGFQTEGGSTHYGFTYINDDGVAKPYRIVTPYFVGYEPVESKASIKLPTPAVPAGSVKKTEPVMVTATPLNGEQPVKRGRGRPRKDPSESPIASKPAVSATGSEPKRRGRPPKDPTAVKAVAPIAAAPVDASGVPVPRKRGRPRKEAVAAPVTVAAPVATVPPHIPTPTIVEDVEEVEETDAVVASPVEKPVIKAVSPEVEDDSPVVVAISDTDDDYEEVVPARQRLTEVKVPARPAASVARANRIPDEVDGDL